MTYPQLRKWSQDPANYEHPKFLDILTELDLVQVLQSKMHNHFHPDHTRQMLKDPIIRAQHIAGVAAWAKQHNIDLSGIDFWNCQDDPKFLAYCIEYEKWSWTKARETGILKTILGKYGITNEYDYDENWHCGHDRQVNIEINDACRKISQMISIDGTL